MNQISDLRKNNYSSFFIMGAAPSLRLFKYYQDFKCIKIGVGDVPWRAPEFGPFDYWVTANPVYPLPWKKQHLKHLLESKSHILLSSSAVVEHTNLESIFFELDKLRHRIPITFFDHRHLGGSECVIIRNCCKFSNRYVTDPSIQEIINNLVNEKGPAYKIGESVALHAFALAIILGAKEIYITGVEIPMVQKDYTHFKGYKTAHETPINMLKRIVRKNLPKFRYVAPADPSPVRFFREFEKLVSIANRLNIKVYSISPTSHINFIQGVTYLEA